jgi:hypothetical protein
MTAALLQSGHMGLYTRQSGQEDIHHRLGGPTHT